MRQVKLWVLPFTLLLLLAPFLSHGQTPVTCVYGKAPDYANQTLIFRQNVGFITDFSVEAGRVTVGKDGVFNCPLKILGSQLLTCEVGAYTFYFYITQGDRLRIGFLPFREETDAERLNPYRERPMVQLRPRGNDSLLVNDMIARFDFSLARSLDSAFASLRHQYDKINGDSIVRALQEEFADARYDNDFFRNYQKYQLGASLYLTRTRHVQALSDSLFKHQPILYDNPAYRSLFNTIYNRYFVFHGRTPLGQQIYKAISTDKSLGELKRVLRQNDNLQPDALLELVILKGLHDEFFSSNFSRGSLAVILDSLNSTTDISEHAFIANYIREKVTKLLPGFAPHPIQLSDINGKLLDIKALRGKPLLLCFAMTTSYTCLQDFEVLNQLHKRWGHALEIVCLLADQNAQAAAGFIESKKYPWHFAHLEDKMWLLDRYDVRAFPTYYLLDENGLLLHSPAPSPREGLERMIAKLLVSKGIRPNEERR